MGSGKGHGVSTGPSHSTNSSLSPSPGIGIGRPVPEDNSPPWFMLPDYEQDKDLVLDANGFVKGGTLPALVARLTQHDVLDASFNHTFLLTYRSFCSTESFLNELFRRFELPVPQGLELEERTLWKKKKLSIVRVRVFNILKTWVDTFYQIEEDGEASLQHLRQWASTVLAEVLEGSSKVLTVLIDRRSALSKMEASGEGGDGDGKKMVPNLKQDVPPSIMPKNRKKIKLTEIDPLEIARQLTLMDSQTYRRIRPTEWLGKAWSNADNPSAAPNMKSMIVASNHLTVWLIESILTEDDIRKRCAIIRHFTAVGEKCRLLNNYNALMAILAGLNSAPIHRLKRTWDSVSNRSMMTLEGLKALMATSRNFGSYREILHSVNPPCVPFVGVYLTDLTFIEDGNPDVLRDQPHLINFSKRAKTADVIREMQQFQAQPYALRAIPEVQGFLKKHLESSGDDTSQYDRSLQMEPREREDEKIARLLHESGFL
ncbi:ras guanine nucleotide exchange factor domain-containing protein [Piptocephalis cylindrospora]|uniref:Ras guanine nucleotide exchange factor domain-containing protein n=1 Tax=Piptocephalis cylindrospora TaxID=1907219 RepID=A0A4P9Y5E1_9FUNG|nr:ras guanine nucleotide exchange factor domain-containing protein [Piptocephalis cylindrospora]|eukprot:RKP13932.1 ras guanine nucleotide exchange factor domain-containing protein [Piptocephalis cylindrospora]